MHTPPDGVLSRLAGLAGIVAAPQLILGIAYASSLRPGFDQLRQVVSELDQAGAPSAAAFEEFAVLPFAVLLTIFAIGLHRSLPAGPVLGPFLVALGGLALAASGLFPCDPGCPIPPVSWAGFEHTGLAVVGLSALAAAPMVLSLAMDLDGRWRPQWWASVGASRLAAFLITSFGLASFLQLAARATLERGLVLVLLVWIALTGRHLFRLGQRSRLDTSLVA